MSRWIRSKTLGLVGVVLVLALLTATTASCKREADTIRMASETWTETWILTQIGIDLIDEYTDLNTEHLSGFGSTVARFDALQAGQIDAYLTWTGTELRGPVRYEGPPLDKQQAYDYVKQYFEEHLDVECLSPLGYDNTYVIAVRRETAEQFGLTKVSDLVGHAETMTFGSEFAFKEAAGDGLVPMCATYGFEFGTVMPMVPELLYQACANKEFDAISAFSTDPRIKQFDLVCLEDDKNFFPPYDGMFIVRKDVLAKHPEVKTALEKVAGRLNNEIVMAMNYAVDIDKKEYEDVAKQFLVDEGLIPGK